MFNYNSPGATGALSIAAMIVNELIEDGKLSLPPESPYFVSNSDNSMKINKNKNFMWDIAAISENLRAPN